MESWSKLPSSSPTNNRVPRGGTGLVLLDNNVWVFLGFVATSWRIFPRFELEQQKWQVVTYGGEKIPMGQSMFGTFTISNNILLYGGEVDPSVRHIFEQCLDVWHSWNGLKLIRCGCGRRDRIWVHVDGMRFAVFGNLMLVYGGSSYSNDRLNDIFLLGAMSRAIAGA